ncbi:uncharacterized protein LOC134820714 isoform X2 [Bolinopsis microptera]|uniref:uncharacterized protein LOC134820714 isoform X2 n=1 Tax=Bolinopsis microptera TaxID=2820187 RepID=UPI003079074F
MTRSITQTILGVTMILAMVQNTEARHVRHHGHRKGNSEISRGDHAVSNQVTTIKLNTAQIFGLHLEGPIAISQSARDAFKQKLKKAYGDVGCKLALEEDGCTKHEILIARHKGNFKNNYDYHYNGLSYNSVTDWGTTLGNDIDSTISKRSTTGAPCLTTTFQCSLSEDEKNSIKEKCWLFDFYVETHTSSLHNMVVQGPELKWSDISKYMGNVGKKLLSVKTDQADIFYPNIYDEIVDCHIGDISSSNIKIVNEYYRKHAGLIQKMHVNFHHLKYAKDDEGNKHDCFQVLLDFMNSLSELQAALPADKNWEDISKISISSTLRDSFTTSMYGPSQTVHFCHRRILVEYSTFIHDRAVMKDNIMQKIKSECITTPALCSSPKYEINLENSLDSGVLYNMRKIFPTMARLLYKTLLMSDPQGRISDINIENNLVTAATKNIDHRFEDITIDINAENYWRKRIKAAKRKRTMQQA